MTLIQFVNKYINMRVDYDGYYGAQCVDLFRQYCKDVLEIAHTGSVEGAKDLFHKYWDLPGERAHFLRLSTTNRPLPGDVLIWDGMTYGHVAIVVATSEERCIVFEQDGYVQDGAKLAVKDYSNALGILRSRKVVRL